MATEPKKLPALLPDVATRPKRNTSILGHSKIFTPEVIDDIHIKSELGRYRMRGFSLFKKIPNWDDLTFLPGTLTRFVIEGYREKCLTETIIGPKAKRPLVLDIPIYITGMSFGALSYEAKMALARGATMAGTATSLRRRRRDPDAPLFVEMVLPVHFSRATGSTRTICGWRIAASSSSPGSCKVGLRPPDGAEGHRSGGGDAVAAGRHRRAPPRGPGLARSRRSGAQNHGDPRRPTGRFRSS